MKRASENLILIFVFTIVPGYNLTLAGMHGYVNACGKAGCFHANSGAQFWIYVALYFVSFFVSTIVILIKLYGIASRRTRKKG